MHKAIPIILGSLLPMLASATDPLDASTVSLFGVFDNLNEPAPLAPARTLTMTTKDDPWTMGTSWSAHASIDETDVFNVELVNDSDATDWTIRIGKGGQLYSIVLPGVGEVTPPQAFEDSRWVDEVFMSTIVSHQNHDTTSYPEKYGRSECHGSGMYMKPAIDPLLDHAFYSPLLAESFDSENRSYSVVNWPIPPTPSINRSNALTYLNYRDLGSGVLEITYYFYSFHDIDYSSVTTPWGGVRHSALPNLVRGTVGDQYEEVALTAAWQHYNIKDAGNGWLARTQDATDPDSMSVAIVTGVDDHWAAQEALMQAGEDHFQFTPTVCSNALSLSNGRDYGVISIGNRIVLKAGTGYFRRIFMVFGTLDDVATKAAALTDDVDYGILSFDESSAELMPLYASTASGQSILVTQKPSLDAVPVMNTYAKPVQGSVPLILMKSNTTGTYFLSTDMYAACAKEPFVNTLETTHENYETYQNRVLYKPYDEQSEWIALLGFVMPDSDSQVQTNTRLLSDVLGTQYAFDAGERDIANQLRVRMDDTEWSVGAVAHWAMDDASGTVVTDFSGNRFDGSLSSGIWSAGVDGSGSVEFDGATGRISIPASAFDSISNEISISLWVYGAQSQPQADSVLYAVNASGQRVLNIHLPWANSTVYWDAGDSSGYDRVSQAADPALFKDQWNHWVFTKNAIAGTMNIYCNGALWIGKTGKNRTVDTITSAVIGGNMSSLSYAGAIDEVRLYDQELSDAEVLELYHSNSLAAHWPFEANTGTLAKDIAGQGFDATISGADWSSDAGGISLDFDAGTDTVSVPEGAFASIDEQITLSMWVNGASTQARADAVLYAENALNERVLKIHLPWIDSRVYWDAGNLGAAYDRIHELASSADFKDGWNYWVFTKDAGVGEMKIYLNGELWHTGTGKFRSMSGIKSINIGSADGVQNYDGQIDDVQLYNRTLTDREIRALYELAL